MFCWHKWIKWKCVENINLYDPDGKLKPYGILKPLFSGKMKICKECHKIKFKNIHHN